MIFLVVTSFETLAIARNIEDLAAEKITTIVPVVAAQRVSIERLSMDQSLVSTMEVRR